MQNLLQVTVIDGRSTTTSKAKVLPNNHAGFLFPTARTRVSGTSSVSVLTTTIQMSRAGYKGGTTDFQVGVQFFFTHPSVLRPHVKVGGTKSVKVGGYNCLNYPYLITIDEPHYTEKSGGICPPIPRWCRPCLESGTNFSESHAVAL